MCQQVDTWPVYAYIHIQAHAYTSKYLYKYLYHTYFTSCHVFIIGRYMWVENEQDTRSTCSFVVGHGDISVNFASIVSKNNYGHRHLKQNCMAKYSFLYMQKYKCIKKKDERMSWKFYVYSS